jgi:phosphoribosylpyrophosphate synthetase
MRLQTQQLPVRVIGDVTGMGVVLVDDIIGHTGTIWQATPSC